MYKNSALAGSFNRVEIEAFSPGSIIVDYYVVLNEVATPITTQVRHTIIVDDYIVLNEVAIHPHHYTCQT
jgi:hypothetical protein